MADYLTVSEDACGELEIKRSRFIGHIRPVATQKQAAVFLGEIRAQNREARHNCYAYCLREENYCKFSDDSEPSGTAGKPILDVIRGSSLEDVCIVVTRYFGGILLGTGGLVRAYSQAAAAAVHAARIITMRQVDHYSLRCDYSSFGKISSLPAQLGGGVEDTVYDDGVTLRFFVPTESSPLFHKMLSEASLGKISALYLSTSYQENHA